ncbi:beta-N-acetylhexosaminidase [Paraflavitalea soli]|uniref:beta-N-acetylhexosaminidase n=1 Tax=Paraflavitalea soli TaxID=2315862 RepID=A0A3B7MUP5_9BACT|nr:beta-N-acetylhexosaminidase [Paraflavitalea soli]AXY78252.1 beta-N-acetylhexosaminidase [Paraflavitalea soli]
MNCRYILTSLLLLIVSAYSLAQSPEPGVIPMPATMVVKDGYFTIAPHTVLLYTDEPSKKKAALFASFILKNHGVALAQEKGSKNNGKNSIYFSHEPRRSDKDESYTLLIDPANIVVSGNETGLFYGVQTMMQLVERNNGNIRLKCADIKDQPRFAYRGIMQDVGYHIYPVSFIKSQIEMLAKYKMNVYHWHLTEDHGWRIEIKKYPRLTSVGAYRAGSQVSHYIDSLSGIDHIPYGGFYTQDEIRDIVAFAKERHVTIIPEIELPGHSMAALAAYPQLACGDKPGPFKVAEHWGIYDDVYCAGKENTFKFLEDVLTEVMELFPSEYIHIGGDECPKDRWKVCKYCQKRIKDQQLKDEFELQSYFVKRIEKFVNSKGRKIIGWDEILEGGLAPNAAVMSWRNIEEGIKAAKQQHDVVMAPQTHVYFDFIQGKRELEPLAIGWGYNPIEKVLAFDPTPAGLSKEEKKHIIGVEAAIWTEHMDTHRKVEYMLYPRLMALAEIAWTRRERIDSVNFFEQRLPLHLAELDTTDKLYRVPGPIGIKDTTLYGVEFRIEMKAPVTGAKIYYNFEGQDARETDFLYDKPVYIVLHKGERRQLKAVVITPSGKRSINTTMYFINL